MKTLPTILLTLAIAIPATWFATRKFHHAGSGSAASPQSKPKGERKLLYHQSAMHPWIKSDKPGRCTICGMELTPVYEGDPGFDASGDDVVPLTQTMIQVMNVQTAEVQVRPLKKTLSVAGMIDDDATRHRVLSAYIPGRVQKLYVNYMGAEVKQGQPLAEFYSPSLLQAEREYRMLTGELRSATALRLLQMGLTGAQIDALPEKHGDKLTSQILAPIGGTVVAQNVYEGQYVQEGETLFEIADFSTMWFQFRAYEQDLPWIKPGLKVDITTPAHPGFTYTGHVAFIDPTLDEATRSAKVRVELPNPSAESGHRMMHKLYADGIVHLDAPEVLTVPRTAVIETGPEAVAYVDESGGAYSRRVLKLGRRGDALIEVASGLSAGDKVVVNGNLLIDGQAEMNRAFAQAPEHSAPDITTNSMPLTEAQKQAISAFVKAADAVSAALAQDDVAQFNAVGPEAMKATEGLVEALKDRKNLEDILEHLADARHLHGAADVAAARKAFHPFANAAARVLEMSASASGSPPFELFECPMVDRAVPGVPKKGRWVQAAGRDIANPYFGADMLDCGVKVKR
ncbi:MAG: efflux RND transporter periplasmic adaptor subunit [Verrucomicrobiales bacterium]|nr:efflux RND transporter periplasmic adaptor subunit [Verrucomicrobiales bacterium]